MISRCSRFQLRNYQYFALRYYRFVKPEQHSTAIRAKYTAMQLRQRIVSIFGDIDTDETYMCIELFARSRKNKLTGFRSAAILIRAEPDRLI